MSQLRIGVLGCGSFAQKFVPLFAHHPFVDRVAVCDSVPERAADYAHRFGVETVPSFTEMLASDVNAVAIFTERHSHGELALQALRAGKHVYSAVPMASSVEECQKITEAVAETGLTYMMGETCYYWPCAMFVREKYRQGEFGRFVFGEAQYYHDISEFHYKVDSHRGIPPFFYPTHSTAMILSSVDSYVTRVTAFGYEDQEDDGIFRIGANLWDNTMSNGYALMKLANGGTARVNECRRIGLKSPSSYISGVYGTTGSYEYSNAQHVFVRVTPDTYVLDDVSDVVNTFGMIEHKDDADFKQQVANGNWKTEDFAPVQMREAARLPEAFRGLPNGHHGSHQLLIDDFCTAAREGTMPRVNNAWDAARFTMPGLMAHESALLDGVPLDVPDCGSAPSI